MSIFSSIKNVATKAVSAVKKAASSVTGKTQKANALQAPIGAGMNYNQKLSAQKAVGIKPLPTVNVGSTKNFSTAISKLPSSSTKSTPMGSTQDFSKFLSTQPANPANYSSAKLTSTNVPTSFSADTLAADGGVTAFETPSYISSSMDSGVGSYLGASGLNSGSNMGMSGSTVGVGTTGAGTTTGMTDLEKKQKEDEQAVSDNQQALIDMMNELAGKPKEAAKLEKQAGLPEANAELRDLQAKQTLQTAQYLQQQQDIQNKPIAMEFIAGQQGESQRRAGIDAMITSALIQGKQGQIQTAQETVDRALSMKYDPLIQRMDFQKQIIQMNYNELSRSDKKLADERSVQLDVQKAKMNQLMDFQNFAIKNAVAQGAPSSVVSKIMQANDIGQISAVGGNYIKQPNTDIVKLDNGNTVVVDKSTGKIISSLGGGVVSGNASIITDDMMKKTYGNDVTSMVSNVIKSNKAKGTVSLVSAINVIAGTQQMAQANPSGEFTGISPVRLLPGKFKSSEALSNLSSIEAINLKVQQWASGAALTDQQTKQVAKITPQKGDTDNQVRTKLNSLTNYMLGQVSGELSGQGINFRTPKVDLFNTQGQEPDPLNLGTTPGSQGDSLGIL